MYTGHYDIAYSYQNQILSVFPNKVMGSFDMCQTPEIYSYNAIQTHYCTLGTDVSRSGSGSGSSSGGSSSMLL